MKVDLHMHTNCSDGVLVPEDLAEKAFAAGLDTIAVTDHDTLAAYDGACRFPDGLRVITGIEMSSEYDGGDVHVLGYYIDPADLDMSDYCRDFKRRRLDRAGEMIARCTALGYTLERREIERILDKGGTVGRPHIARMLISRGYFPDVKTVFNALLYRGGPAYVPYKRCSIEECIDLIHGAGGIAVLAHPSLVKSGLAEVLGKPFDGVEVYHPRNRGRYDEFLAGAHRRGRLVSGGSDFHGTAGRYPEQIGVYTVDGRDVRAILDLRKGEE